MKRNRIKNHIFAIRVVTRSKRRMAETALLTAFASREPDGMLFHLLKRSPPKRNIAIRLGVAK